jgi:biotin carboxyl carrier protein
MKYTVKIEERTFEVEINDLHSRPIIALVDGTPIEVWPENNTNGRSTSPRSAPASAGTGTAAPGARPSAPTPKPAASAAQVASAATGNGSAKTLLAPIPGTIVAVLVQPGDTVSVGQEVCTLEAMKMKNAIRATRAGTIGRVHVQTGQTVKHHEVLVEYAD